MRAKNLRVLLPALAIALVTASVSFAQTTPPPQAPAGRGAAAPPSPAARTARFGVWDNSTNPNNVMTYELYEKDGSKLTVSNPSNPASDWSYVTLFDGVFRPVTGQAGAETAVELIDERSIRITNKRNGVVNQVVINTISADGNTISNEYIRLNPEGKIMSVSHVTYNRRIKK
jgi:hypothetical protein